MLRALPLGQRGAARGVGEETKKDLFSGREKGSFLFHGAKIHNPFGGFRIFWPKNFTSGAKKCVKKFVTRWGASIADFSLA